MPTGTPEPPGFVSDGCEPGPVTEVLAAVLVRNGRVFIARNKPGSRHAGRWEFPGGKPKPGETPHQCLRREFQEEFGITVAVGVYLGDARHRYAHGMVHLSAYFATWQAGRLCPVDHDRHCWVPAEELMSYALLPADVNLARQLLAVGLPESLEPTST